MVRPRRPTKYYSNPRHVHAPVDGVVRRLTGVALANANLRSMAPLKLLETNHGAYGDTGLHRDSDNAVSILLTCAKTFRIHEPGVPTGVPPHLVPSAHAASRNVHIEFDAANLPPEALPSWTVVRARPGYIASLPTEWWHQVLSESGTVSLVVAVAGGHYVTSKPRRSERSTLTDAVHAAAARWRSDTDRLARQTTDGRGPTDRLAPDLLHATTATQALGSLDAPGTAVAAAAVALPAPTPENPPRVVTRLTLAKQASRVPAPHADTPELASYAIDHATDDGNGDGDANYNQSTEMARSPPRTAKTPTVLRADNHTRRPHRWDHPP